MRYSMNLILNLTYLLSSTLLVGCAGIRGGQSSTKSPNSIVSDSLCRQHFEMRMESIGQEGVLLTARDSIWIGCSFVGSNLESIKDAEKILRLNLKIDSLRIKQVYDEELQDSLFELFWFQLVDNSWESFCSELYFRTHLIYLFNFNHNVSNVYGTIYTRKE